MGKMQFRPCIDLHQGVVKQIIGATLSNDPKIAVKTNYQADKPAEWYAELYRRDNLKGGHIIQLGPGNEKVAQAALKTWPGGMQIGGGITVENAVEWLDAGAGAVIVTSWVFHHGTVDEGRLKRLVQRIGKNRLVLDLSCRRRGDEYVIVTDRWQTFTDAVIRYPLLDYLSGYCHEFLIHAVDVEGKCQGIEKDLLEFLSQWDRLPVTYAGGIRSMADIHQIEKVGRGEINFTVGSALDIFGGGLSYDEIVRTFSGAAG